MHVGEPRDEREANAQAALGTIERRVRLHEEVEDARQHVGADADARVPHADDRVWTLALDGDGDTASRRRVLRGVAQQVLEHLPETHGVARDRHRCARDADLEAMSAGVHDRRGSPPRRCRTMLAMSRRSRLSEIFPCVTRDTSSRSSTIRVMRRAWRAMISSGRFASGAGI